MNNNSDINIQLSTPPTVPHRATSVRYNGINRTHRNNIYRPTNVVVMKRGDEYVVQIVDVNRNELRNKKMSTAQLASAIAQMNTSRENMDEVGSSEFNECKREVSNIMLPIK